MKKHGRAVIGDDGGFAAVINKHSLFMLFVFSSLSFGLVDTDSLFAVACKNLEVPAEFIKFLGKNKIKDATSFALLAAIDCAIAGEMFATAASDCFGI